MCQAGGEHWGQLAEVAEEVDAKATPRQIGILDLTRPKFGAAKDFGRNGGAFIQE